LGYSLKSIVLSISCTKTAFDVNKVAKNMESEIAKVFAEFVGNSQDNEKLLEDHTNEIMDEKQP